METPDRGFSFSQGASLGNFLSGMETFGAYRWYAGEATLETSLVEWKLVARGSVASTEACLGNFLSGMETFFSPRERAVRANLGNFLSGMETSEPAPY